MLLKDMLSSPNLYPNKGWCLVMKPIIIIAVILIILGVLSLGVQGISYISHDKVIDMGPIQVSADRKHTIPIAPIIGVIALIAGIGLILSSKRD